ncbi:MAG: hypothetical protein H6Q05_4040 [Acidobacteria bacterium]|jgi:hypothetical protein|nr:hypothetical protein [Acidobacteriota bacterium]
MGEGQPRLVLKETAGGWFAAGSACRKAASLLSDGAFKLFFHICLEADRRTGSFRASYKELAAALGKSKRAIGIYVAELERKAICRVHQGTNQFAATTFTISDSYWPYHCPDIPPASPHETAYVNAVREWFLSLGCVSGKFGAADQEIVRQMHRRSIPLAVIENAMLLGACRKYSSWLQGQALEPILSVRYFESLIAEIQKESLPPGYSGYLRKKIRQLTDMWNESVKSGRRSSER